MRPLSHASKKMPVLLSLDYYNIIPGLVINLTIVRKNQINVLFFTEKSFEKYTRSRIFPKVITWFETECGARFSYVNDCSNRLEEIDLEEVTSLIGSEYFSVTEYYKGRQLLH